MVQRFVVVDQVVGRIVETARNPFNDPHYDLRSTTGTFFVPTMPSTVFMSLFEFFFFFPVHSMSSEWFGAEFFDLSSRTHPPSSQIFLPSQWL
jgi:hypothetical protein